jgi:hypothetical protein
VGPARTCADRSGAEGKSRRLTRSAHGLLILPATKVRSLDHAASSAPRGGRLARFDAAQTDSRKLAPKDSPTSV